MTSHGQCPRACVLLITQAMPGGGGACECSQGRG